MIQQMFLCSFPLAYALKLMWLFKGELLYPLVSAYLLLCTTKNLSDLVLKSLPNYKLKGTIAINRYLKSSASLCSKGEEKL